MDADLALRYYLANSEELQNDMLDTRAVDLIPGHVQNRSVVDADREAPEYFFGSKSSHHTGALDCFLIDTAADTSSGSIVNSVVSRCMPL